MIKNMMHSKLFVLFSMLFCSLVVSVLLFGTSSNAYTDYLLNKYQTDFYNAFNYHDTSNNDNFILTYWDSHYESYPYMFIIDLGSSMRYYFIQNDIIISGNKIYINGNFAYFASAKNTNLAGNPVTGTYNNSLTAYTSDTYLSVGPYDVYSVPDVDFDNPIYAVNIPVPELDVTYMPAISMLGGLPQTNNVFTSISVGDNSAFKVQLSVKITVADMVQIGLTDGTTTYKYLDWTEGTLSDIYSLQDMQDAEDILITNSDLQPVWSALYNSLYDDQDFPTFSSSVPFWNSNPNAQKYLDAKSYYRNNMARQMPMYGTRLEVFARYFAIDGTDVYVSAWRHWNSAEPLNTEKVTDKYQDQHPFPGTENINTNIDYDNSDDTYTTIGTQTGVYSDPYTQVVINQNVPNYPDYPTAVSYNHDNILVQMIQTANQLPNFFGQFGNFLTSAFSFIDRSVWAIIGFGFMCSIVVMIIKIL